MHITVGQEYVSESTGFRVLVGFVGAETQDCQLVEYTVTHNGDGSARSPLAKCVSSARDFRSHYRVSGYASTPARPGM